MSRFTSLLSQLVNAKTGVLILGCMVSFHASLIPLVLAKAPAQDSKATIADKTRAERAKSDIEQELKALQNTLEKKESERNSNTQSLKQADVAISETNRKLRQLEIDRKKIERDIQSLRHNDRELAKGATETIERLKNIARAQFLNQQRSPWQTLIDGNNPSTITREEAMLEFLARDQQKNLAQLANKRDRIKDVTTSHEQQKARLLAIKSQEEKERTTLLEEKKEREAALKQLSQEISSQHSKIERLQKDQERLGRLISSIETQLKKQEQARRLAETQRKAAMQKERQAQKSLAQSQDKHPTNEEKSPFNGQGQFAKLRGQLTPPVKGKLVARYGTNRAESSHARSQWQGLRFTAPEGSEVVACASGKVVFSDWLRGYGNLIIIDHGNRYLSVYGNNEALYKNVGDYVKQGETISSVGTSGESDEPGVYFELRYNSKPFDPQPWLKR